MITLLSSNPADATEARRESAGMERTPTMLKKSYHNSQNSQGINLQTVPDDSQLAARWVEKFPQTVYYNGKYYRPAIDGFIEIDKTIIQQEIYIILQQAVSEGCKVNRRRLSSVMELARIDIVILDFQIGGVK